MNLINRGFLSVKPRARLIEWALAQDPSLLLDNNPEASIYLIEEEFWDDDVVINNYAKKIAQHEFISLGFEQDEWPTDFSLADFQDWFLCELGCTCIDLLNAPIQQEAL